MIFINYFSDILNGLGAHFYPPLSIAGPSIRGGLVLLGVFLLKGEIFRSFSFLSFFFLVYLIFHSIYGSGFNMALEFQQITKIFFPICFASILYFFCKETVIDEILVIKVFSFSGFLLSIGVIGSILLGVDAETYSEGSFGQKGIMLNQNDMALLFSIAIFYSSYGALKYGKIFLLNCALCIISAILLGTRLGVLSAVVFPLAAYVFYIRSNDISVIKKICLLPLFIAGCVGISCVVFWLVINDPYLAGKFIMMMEGSSPRGQLFNVGLEIISRSTNIDYIFGHSATDFYNLVQDKGGFYSYHSWGKRVEVDPIDIVGCYGVVIYIILVVVFFKPLWSFISKINEVFYAMLALTLLFLFLHSIFLGHVMTQPISGGILGFILFLDAKKDSLLNPAMVNQK